MKVDQGKGREPLQFDPNFKFEDKEKLSDDECNMLMTDSEKLKIVLETLRLLLRDKWANNQELKWSDCTIGTMIRETLKEIGEKEE